MERYSLRADACSTFLQGRDKQLHILNRLNTIYPVQSGVDCSRTSHHRRLRWIVRLRLGLGDRLFLDGETLDLGGMWVGTLAENESMAKLYFYYSAMNAGKSTTLLQSAYNYEERGMRVVLMTPQLDKRHGTGRIASRIGLAREAFPFSGNDDLFLYVQHEDAKGRVHCVLVDEAQFLTDRQVLQLTQVCDQLNIPVLCYGIRTDFQGEPFEGSKYLLAWAEELVEIKTVCATGKKATMNARVDVDGNRVTSGAQVDIGHHYVAMSRKEFGLEKVSPIALRGDHAKEVEKRPEPVEDR
jgi:thymidine kinase